MRSVFYSAAFAALASAQSSSVDAFPQTTLLGLTNSLGVVTGQPPVATEQPSLPDAVTSQPAVVTSQPLPADIPAVGPGLNTLTLAGTGSAFNTTRTIVVSADSSTTILIQTSSTTPASASGSDASASAPSGSGADDAEPTDNAASNVKAMAGSALGFGAILAAFL